MSKINEFQSKPADKIQNDFFLDELPTRKNKCGIYYYRKSGLKAKLGSTLVLFQYDNMIIATAELTDIQKFSSPTDGYSGAFYFKPSSIQVFTPVSSTVVNTIFHTNIKFTQAKHKLDHSKAKAFLNSLQNVRTI